jgi:hypothetical protein
MERYGWSRLPLGFSGEKDVDVDGDGEGGRADKASGQIGVAHAIWLVLAQKPKAIPKLDQVIGTRIDDDEPSTRPQHARHFGEVSWGENAHDKIGHHVVYRPLGPEIRYSEGRHRPTSGRLPRRALRNVETQADGARQPRSYPGDVMTRARTSIQDMPGTSRGSLDLTDDRCRERAEMPRVEYLRAVPELRRAITARSWAASSTG